MSDAIKWGLLAAGIVVLVGLIVLLPFNSYIDTNQLTGAIVNIIDICGSAFSFARGLINNFLSPFGRTALTGLLVYLFGKYFITLAVKMSAWVYHFVFRG